MKIKPKVTSEFGRLRTVLVHKPGDEISVLTNENQAEFLFESVPDLPLLRAQHEQFQDGLRSASAQAAAANEQVEVLVFETLLTEILAKDKAAARNIVCRAVEFEGTWVDCNRLLECDPDVLARILIGGISAREYRRMGAHPGAHASDDVYGLEPLPNLYFMRDPAFVIGSTVFASSFSKRARQRESFLVEDVIRHHPCFEGTNVVRPFDSLGRPATVEGGDVTVVNDKMVLVGNSERTNSLGVSLLAKELFANEPGFEVVHEVVLPRNRYYMHLDTIFTILATGKVLEFEAVLGRELLIRTFERGKEAPAYQEATLKHILEGVFGTIENIGVTEPSEQKRDAANVIVVDKDCVVAYDENTNTNKKLRAAGVFVKAVQSSELVDGLGGPRCMTMPITRG